MYRSIFHVVRIIICTAAIVSVSVAQDPPKTPLDKLDLKKIAPALRPKGTPKEVIAILGERDGRYDSISFRSDGGQMAIGGMDGLLRLWDMTSLKVTGTAAHKDVVCHTFSASGKSLIIGDAVGNLRAFTIASGKLAQASQIVAHKPGPIWDLALSPDGKVLATGGADKLVKLWDATKFPLTLKATLTGHDDRVRGLAFSPDGKLLVSTSDRDSTIRVWDLSDKPREKAKLTLKAAAKSVAISPEGKTLIAGCVDGVLRSWKLGDKVETDDDIRGGQGGIAKVIYTPDGTSILGLVKWNQMEDRVFRWDLKGKVLFESKYDRPIEALGLDPGGKHGAVVHEANIFVIRP
ncbi:MAG: hypothetical protein K8T89_08745 [Planctomycetes bacterium]|nr:hypothetical protein [Planctomycetota bacterium]